MKKIVLFIICFNLFLSVGSGLYGSEVNPTHSFYLSPKYKVEEMETVLHENGLFVVNGKIRNTDIHPTKGYVIIYFANNSDDVIEVAETDVNDKNPINPGSTGLFELTTTTERYKQITRTYIEYIVREKIVTPKKPLITIGKKK